STTGDFVRSARCASASAGWSARASCQLVRCPGRCRGVVGPPVRGCAALGAWACGMRVSLGGLCGHPKRYAVACWRHDQTRGRSGARLWTDRGGRTGMRSTLLMAGAALAGILTVVAVIGALWEWWWLVVGAAMV